MAQVRTPVKGVVQYAQVARAEWPADVPPAQGEANAGRVFLRILTQVLMDDGEVVEYESEILEFRPVKK